MLLRVTKTLALFACVAMVAMVTNVHAGGGPCAPGSPCVKGVPCVPNGYYCYGPQPRYYCPNGHCCKPSDPWGYSPRQWMPWPGEDRQDVGAPVPLQGHERVQPQGEGFIPPQLPKEEYPELPVEGAPNGRGTGTGGIGGLPIGGGTGETTMPFHVPSGPSGLDIGIPSGKLPSGDLPIDDKPKEGLSPDDFPTEPLPIEGTKEKEEDKKPAAPPLPTETPAPVKDPLDLGQQGEAPLPLTEIPTIRVKEAPLPNRPNSLVVRNTTIQPLPAVDGVPAYAPAPLPDVRPSSYPSSRPAPIYNDPPIPADQWRPRRTMSEEPAPLPNTEVPSEGRHVMYEQAPEAPMPEAIPTAVREEPKPLALEGYCPVELVLNERWVKGDPQWTATHQGRSYRFSSREAFDSFCRKPELYAPYYSGIDPILALVGGGMVDGRTDLCAVYRGQLYMFSSQKSLDQFRANPAECVEAFKANLKTK